MYNNNARYKVGINIICTSDDFKGYFKCAGLEIYNLWNGRRLVVISHHAIISCDVVISQARC